MSHCLINTKWKDDFVFHSSVQKSSFRMNSSWKQLLIVCALVCAKKGTKKYRPRQMCAAWAVCFAERELGKLMMCFVVSSYSAFLESPGRLLLLISAGTCLYISGSTRTMHIFCWHYQTFINDCLRWFKNWVKLALRKRTDAVLSVMSDSHTGRTM